MNDSPRPVTDVVFDYRGVLVDWRPRRTVEALYPPGVVDMFFDPSDPHGVGWCEALTETGWDDERVIARYGADHGPAVAWIMRLYLRHRALGFYDMPEGMAALLRELHARGVRLWGLTNDGVRGVELMRRRFPWLALLRDTVVSGAEGVRMPDPRLYRRAIARFGIEPSTSLFVDDERSHVEAARREGFRAVRFDGARPLRDLLLG